MENLSKLEKILQIKFNDSKLLKEALTHQSYATEHNLSYNNQRLELLGDAVVQIVITEYIFLRYPDADEGELTQIRAALANQSFLARMGRQISLGEFIRLGKGEMEMNGQDRDSTLSDAFESLVAAVYLDQGQKAVNDFLVRNIEALCHNPRSLVTDMNPKGSLQEYTQAHGMGIPFYEIILVSGPDHRPNYEVQVLIQDKVIASGLAKSRKLAEQNAAKNALRILCREEDHDQ